MVVRVTFKTATQEPVVQVPVFLSRHCHRIRKYSFTVRSTDHIVIS